MSDFVVNSTVNTITSLIQTGKTHKNFALRAERLENGLRINHGADDPSGMGISSSMTARMRGISTAIQNVETGIDMIHTADMALSETNDILQRIHDICVRGANSATLEVAPNAETSGTDVRSYLDEIGRLQEEIYRKANAVTFNNAKVLKDYSAPNGKLLQAGPDNVSQDTIRVEIPDLENFGIPVYIPSPGPITEQGAHDAFLLALDNAKSNIASVSAARAAIGAQENRLASTLDDLNSEYINVSASRSSIMDADMAVEITELTKANILSSMSYMAMQAGAVDPNRVYTLLNSAGL